MIQNISDRVLFEDNHCLVVNKPSGVLCAGSADGDETIESQLKAFLKQKYKKAGAVYLTLIHRIDRPTSGCVLLAKTSKAASRLSESMRLGEISKVYFAVVEGELKEAHGSWSDFLMVDEKVRRTRVVPKGTQNAMVAKLNFKTTQVPALESSGLCATGLEIELETGRKHQIRAQCAHRGYPIVGDTKYGAKKWRQNEICLHAWKLSFKHPTREEVIHVEAPLPNWN